ncbi:hypothetical protein BD408DRAFT_444387 [Parasitella parasitica]|nr:hypothetical protein BD408DRAFT_444387 [Parasitella parasitica]
MYATTKPNNDVPMYHTNNVAALTSTSAIVNDPYHWDHSIHVMIVSPFLVTPMTPSDSAVCHPEQTKGMNINQPSDSINRRPLNSHQPSLMYRHSAGPRAVIPSKRAAQNRAAQRAFRQRRERYVKELEKKAKLMDEWKAEIDQLRQQNKELRQCNMRLEKQMHQLNSLDFEQQELISPIHSPSLAAEIIPAPVVVVMDQPTMQSARRRATQEPQTLRKYQASFMPGNPKAPDHTSFIASPTISCSSSSSSSSFNGLEDVSVQQATYQPDQIPWSTPTPSNFDHYAASLDFMSGGQDLDDLCAILQARQRTENSYNYSSDYNTTNCVISEQDLPIHQQSDSMLLATSF